MPGIRNSGRRPDRLHRHGLLREDGRTVHSMFPLQVRKPEESKAPWDYHKVLAEVPGNQAFRPRTAAARRSNSAEGEQRRGQTCPLQDPFPRNGRILRGTYRGEEPADLVLEPPGIARQRLGGRENLRRGRTGLGGTALHVDNAGIDLLSPKGGLLHVPGDLQGRSALLSDRFRDDRGNLRHPTDGVADRLDGEHRFLRLVLDAADLLADLIGGFRR